MVALGEVMFSIPKILSKGPPKKTAETPDSEQSSAPLDCLPALLQSPTFPKQPLINGSCKQQDCNDSIFRWKAFPKTNMLQNIILPCPPFIELAFLKILMI